MVMTSPPDRLQLQLQRRLMNADGSQEAAREILAAAHNRIVAAHRRSSGSNLYYRRHTTELTDSPQQAAHTYSDSTRGNGGTQLY